MKNVGAYRETMNRDFVLAVGIASLLLSSVTLFAQNPGYAQRNDDQRSGNQPNQAQGNYEGTANGVSAGGNWMQYSSEDRMTAAKRVRFELPANNSANSDDHAEVILYCTN